MWTGYHPQEDLPTFGYTSERKLFSLIFSILKYGEFVPFSKKTFCRIHSPHHVFFFFFRFCGEISPQKKNKIKKQTIPQKKKKTRNDNA